MLHLMLLLQIILAAGATVEPANAASAEHIMELLFAAVAPEWRQVSIFMDDIRDKKTTYPPVEETKRLLSTVTFKKQLD